MLVRRAEPHLSYPLAFHEASPTCAVDALAGRKVNFSRASCCVTAFGRNRGRLEAAEAVTMSFVTETNPLAEVFSKIWTDLSPRSRALFMHSIASYFGVGEPPVYPIFHYASADTFVNILRRREIWATNAAYLNDANELSYPVTLAQQVLDDLAQEESDADLKSFVHDVAQDVGTHQVYKAWYVASFSSDGNLLSQWRAYCPRGGFPSASIQLS